MNQSSLGKRLLLMAHLAWKYATVNFFHLQKIENRENFYATTLQTQIVLEPDYLVDAYGIARRNYYYRLGDRRPSLRKFAKRRDGGKGGWITRAEEFIAPRFHLSRLEHDQRTAAWV